MFAKFVFTRAALALIPILGLCSCSQDRKDEWAISEPTLSTETLSIPVSAADNRAFPFSTKINFHDKTWTSLVVNTECRMNSQTFSDSFSLTYRDTLDLKSLWPRALTARFPDRDLQNSECDFKFVAANDTGSTHAFEIHAAKLETFVASPASTSEFHRAGGFSISVRTESSALLQIIDRLMKVSEPASEASLICDDEIISVKSEPRPEQTLRSLLKASSFTDRRLCHFSVNAPEADTNLFAISHEMNLRFTPPRLAVSAQTLFPTSPGDIGFFEIQIGNPNDEQALLKIPSQPPNVRERLIYKDDKSVLAVGKNELNLSVSMNVTGAQKISGETYSLPPRSTMVIRFTHPYWCASFQLGAVRPVGFRWGFEKPLVIEQSETPGAPLYTAPFLTDTYSYPASALAPDLVNTLGPVVPDWVQAPFINASRCL
jgi:hypothetical protein